MGGTRHIAYIDGLRAVAVLAVIAFHLDSSWLPGGFAGVDVFFVISGFVVSASLAGFDRPGLWSYLVYFYSRRIRRIAPALIVCLLVTGVASALFIPEAWLSNANDGTGLWAFVGLSNIWLLENAGDYFSPKTEFNPYTHTWSLGVEEQFYLVFPLLFAVWSYRRRRLSLMLFAAAAAGSLAFAAMVHQDRPAYSFYMLTTRFWELGAGVVLFQALSLRKSVPEAVRARTAGAVVATIVLAVGLWTARGGRTPFPDGALPVLGTLGLLGFLYGGHGGGLIRRALESRGAVLIGKISYSLYLWHWPVFVLFRWTAGLDTALTRGAAVALTFTAATLSYRYVERPFRYGTLVVRAPRVAVLAVGLVVIAASGLSFREIYQRQPAISLSVVADKPADWYPDKAAGKPACGAPPGTGDLAGGTIVRFTRHPCERTDSDRRVYVIGDSHAIMFDAMLQGLAERTGHEVLRYFKGGCAVLNLRQDYLVPGCGPFAQLALSDMARGARAGDVLFLPSLRLVRLADAYERFGDEQALQGMVGAEAVAAREQAESVAKSLLAPLARRGVHIVFEAPTPLFRSPPYRCVDWFSRSNPICEGGLTIERRFLERLRAPVLASFGRLTADVNGLTVWDPFPILCPDPTMCRAMRGDRPLFLDADHVSGYANRMLLPSFSAHLAGLDKSSPKP